MEKRKTVGDMRREAITDTIGYMDHSCVVDIWNKICDKDDRIYGRDEFPDAAEAYVKTFGYREFAEALTSGNHFDVEDDWWFMSSSDRFSKSLGTECFYSVSDDDLLIWGESPIDMDRIVDKFMEDFGMKYFGESEREYLMSCFLDELTPSESAEDELRRLLDNDDVDLCRDEWDDIYNRISGNIA